MANRCRIFTSIDVSKFNNQEVKTLNKGTQRKFIKGWMAALIVLSSTLAPLLANPGIATASNTITRIGGADQYATAALMAQKGWPGTCDNVVLSAGMNYSLVDALAAGPLAATVKAPILLTDDGQSLNSSTREELVRLKPKKAYITSGVAVIKPAVIEELKSMGITPVQLGGYDQYETSVNIAKEISNQGVNSSQIILAAGWVSPADAMSIAPIAAAQGIPILTTSRDQLPTSVQTYLDSIKTKVTVSYVVGGTAVIADAVKGQLPGNVTRYFGTTKYDTNVQILKGFAKYYRNSKVYVANGETLVDALAGVSLAASDKAPIVLIKQQLDQTTEDFVKSTMSTSDLVAMGGEVVVPTAGINALMSAVTYVTDNATLGSTDAKNPAELTDNVQIIGNNITLAHAQADYSVYVKGNNITLSDVTVKGTVFVDPGDTGTATLEGVTAANVVILSGAKDSIHLRNTRANLLNVDSSSSSVHVEATGTTNIGMTVVRSFAIVDAQGGSLGEVSLTSSPGQTPLVELRGTFTQPIVVSGQVNLKAAANTVVPSVVINTDSPDQKVTLDGSFKTVEMQSGGRLDLAANTSVETMKTVVKAEIKIPVGSNVNNLDLGSTGTEAWGGGKANGQATTTTQPTPPVVTTPVINPPTVTPPATGGSASPVVVPPTDTTPTKLTVSAIKALASDNELRQIASGDSIDFTGVSDSVRFTGLQLSTDQASPDIVITSIQVDGLELIKSGQTFKSTIDSNGVVTTSALLAGLDKGSKGLSLQSLRSLLGTGDLVFKGKITKTGYTDSDEITVTIHLGDRVN